MRYHNINKNTTIYFSLINFMFIYLIITEVLYISNPILEFQFRRKALYKYIGTYSNYKILILGYFLYT